MNLYYPGNRPPLAESAFSFLPLGAVKPAGWLKEQLRIQADGLSGHLSEFWPPLGPDSGWLGGAGESWERGPYYLDGLVPLAYLLADQRLIAEVQRWLNWILNSQDESGHFGPKALLDWWPFGVILKALTQYQEATGDGRVIPLMERFFGYMRHQLPEQRLRQYPWAMMRWADTVLSVMWLYNRSGDPDLLRLAEMINRQGYDWTWHFRDFAYGRKQKDLFPMTTHGVNNAMGIKAPAIAYALTRWPEHREGVRRAIDVLDQYHGTAAGVFTCDEHLAGKDPIQGTELCTVAEYMFSLEQALQQLGEGWLGDRLELIAYNAWPATFSPDMWAHQYDQQANQVLCSIAKRPWASNGDDSNIFGLEPVCGCCTANMHQGWPKFIAQMWMATPDNGLAAVTYGPCQVRALVQGQKPVVVDVATDYPFDETIRMRIDTGGEKHVAFPLRLRIPAWAQSPELTVGPESIAVVSGSFAELRRDWQNGEVLELKLPMAAQVERRSRGAVTFKRGPLVYALRIGERWEKLRGEAPHADYAVHPTTPWNYGVMVDPARPKLKVVKNELRPPFFSAMSAPVELRVSGRPIPEWQMEQNTAGPAPESPASSGKPAEELTLIPYGCAKLRITEFPIVTA